MEGAMFAISFLAISFVIDHWMCAERLKDVRGISFRFLS
jgi:hypothetical protein